MIDTTGQDRQSLEATYGKVWDEDELAQEFRVTAIIAPQVVEVRKRRPPGGESDIPERTPLLLQLRTQRA